MKKFGLLILFCVSIFFITGNSWSYEGFYKNEPRGNRIGRIPTIPSIVLRNLKIMTDTSGGWLWKVDVVNKQPFSINGSDFIVQGYAQEVGSTRWIPASGSIVSTGPINRFSYITVTLRWRRCCGMYRLKAVLISRKTRKIIYKTMISFPSLLQGLPFGVHIKRIEWYSTNKMWKATVVNPSNYYLNIGVQGYIIPPRRTDTVPAGGTSVFLNPNSQGTAIGYAPYNTVNGSTLRVHIWYSSHCPQDRNVRRCGFNHKWEIIVPNSREF